MDVVEERDDPHVPIATACKALGLSRATLYRNTRPPPPRRVVERAPSPRRLSDEERAAIRDLFDRPEFVDQPVPEVYAALLKLGRLRGTKIIGDILDNQQLHLHVFAMVREAIAWLDRTLPLAARFPKGSIFREDRQPVPAEALRETIINIEAPTFKVEMGVMTVTFRAEIRPGGEAERAGAKPSLGTDLVGHSVTDSVGDLVDRLLGALERGPLATSQLQTALGMKHRPTFKENYLKPALAERLIEMTVPEKPSSRLQEYRPPTRARERSQSAPRKAEQPLAGVPTDRRGQGPACRETRRHAVRPLNRHLPTRNQPRSVRLDCVVLARCWAFAGYLTAGQLAEGTEP